MALRGAGDVRTPLWIGLVTNVVNVVADYALIFGRLGAPELGAVGSAVATGIAILLGGLIPMALWLRGDLVLARGAWLASATRARCARLLRVGLPTAAEQVAWQLGLLLFLGLVALYWLMLAWNGLRRGRTRGFGWRSPEWSGAAAQFAGRIARVSRPRPGRTAAAGAGDHHRGDRRPCHRRPDRSRPCSRSPAPRRLQ